MAMECPGSEPAQARELKPLNPIGNQDQCS